MHSAGGMDIFACHPSLFLLLQVWMKMNIKRLLLLLMLLLTFVLHKECMQNSLATRNLELIYW